MSGYQLRQLIERSIGNFWRESYGQIYPALKRLEAEGMISSEIDAGAGRIERKLYMLTETGRERLQGWLHLPAHERVPRNELLLKVFFSTLVPLSVLEKQLQSFLAQQRLLQKHYLSIKAELERQHHDHPSIPFWLMTVDYGLAEAHAHSAWAEGALRIAKGLKAKQPSGSAQPVRRRKAKS